MGLIITVFHVHYKVTLSSFCAVVATVFFEKAKNDNEADCGSWVNHRG